MDFITEEVVKQLNLTPEQIEGLKPVVTNHIADLQKGWDGKANENAERIISGAAESVVKRFGVEEQRQAGEKAADYLARVSEKAFSETKTSLELAKTQYEQKLKDFNGGDATKAELDKAKAELDNAKKQLADFDTYKAKAEKLESLEGEYLTMKKQMAYKEVKPSFPDTVNPYEAKAKWEDFIKEVESKYHIELVDGVATAIDKENQYKTIKLKDLVAQNKDLQDLVQGRQQRGLGGHQKDGETIEGVPFAVPKDATSDERTKAIRDYLATQGVSQMSPNYATEFAKYNRLILAKK